MGNISITQIFGGGADQAFKSSNVTNSQKIAVLFQNTPFDKLSNIYKKSPSMQYVFKKHHLYFPQSADYINFFLSRLTNAQADEITKAFVKDYE